MSTEDPKDQQIRERDERIHELEAKLSVALGRIAELERRLGFNSGNSSKPPSSDGLRRTQSLRGKSGKKSGGQPNHKGATLKMVLNPDKVESHKAEFCTVCQKQLSQNGGSIVERRQVFDLPVIALEVTEHQVIATTCCHCGVENRGSFPESVKAPVQYGARVRATVGYLRSQQLIPEERTAEVLGDLFGCPISPGTVGTINIEAAQRLKQQAQQIREELLEAPVKCVNESGVRIAGKTRWVHVLSNETATSYRMEEKRGAIPELRGGTIVHDCFGPYDKLEEVKHALCNAHLLRELQAVEELDKEPWAAEVSELLKLFNKIQMDHPIGVPPEIVASSKELLLGALNRAIEFYDLLPPLPTKKLCRGRKKKRPGHNLALRMRERIDSVLLFLSDANVPFTNNQAERDLRMIKTQQKISGSFRTLQGANNFAIVRSVCSTLRKRGQNIVEHLREVFNSNYAPDTG